MNAWTGRRVLLTGAEGFIGSALARLLVAEGAEVRAFAHYKPYGDKGNLAGLDVEVLAGDIRDSGRVQAAIAETHPVRPQSPYSASKIGADMLALSYWHAFELPVSVVRPFNTYGPRQSARAIVPTILEQLHAGAREIRLGSTTPTRDFTYVEDTARGFMAVAASPRAVGEVVNLGSGKEIAIGDLAAMLVDIVGVNAHVVTDDTRRRSARGEVPRLMRATGWQPAVGLWEGLARTSEWIRRHRREVNYL